jgi:hypothetical protein
MDEKELAKQLTSYADNFTAFSFVQGAAFCFLLVQSVPVGCALRSRWYLAEPLLLLSGVGYFWLLRRCHRGEDELIGVPGNRGDAIGNVVFLVRKIRFALVFIATLLEVAIVIGARFFSAGLNCGCKP